MSIPTTIPTAADIAAALAAASPADRAIYRAQLAPTPKEQEMARIGKMVNDFYAKQIAPGGSPTLTTPLTWVEVVQAIGGTSVKVEAAAPATAPAATVTPTAPAAAPAVAAAPLPAAPAA